MVCQDPDTKLVQEPRQVKSSYTYFYPRFFTVGEPRFLTHSCFVALEIEPAALS